MVRRVVSITGSRADYGLMEPIHRAIAIDSAFDLHLVITGMHFLPEFATGLAQVRGDKFGTLHEVPLPLDKDSSAAMAQSVGYAIIGVANILAQLRPDIVLLQGDRGEMLAGAIVAAHMNIPIVHMSGGDFSGSIDDSVRNAISKLAHIHLTNCDASTRRLVALGEVSARIVEVGEPGLDQLRTMDFLPIDQLTAELDLPRDKPFLIATLHPVTDEVAAAKKQMTTLLEALAETRMVTVFTYPNSDAGGRAMRDVLESWRSRSFLRIDPNLGSRRYLSLLRHAAAIVGNSSSGIYDSPTLKIPVVNIGSRQMGRMRANNVVDVDSDKQAIVDAIRFVLNDSVFRAALADCRNPFGDGHAAERTIDVLRRLRLGPDLIVKWRPFSGQFLTAPGDDV